MDRHSGRGRARGKPAPRAPLRLRRLLLPLILAAVTLLVVVLYFTPLLGVRSVEVGGTTTLGRQKIVDTASIRMGTPMLRVDETEIRDRLHRITRIASARVELSWPSTVKLEIVERTPVAFVATGTGFRLVGAEGVPFATVSRPPEIPELRAERVAADDPATKAAMTVLTSLPEPVRSQVRTVIARRPDSLVNVELLLTDNRKVQWGSARLSERKAAILPPLLTRPGSVYDVRSPSLPTVS